MCDKYRNKKSILQLFDKIFHEIILGFLLKFYFLLVDL